MPHFPSYDLTELAYHEVGSGEPLICLPGGPGHASAYLGNLGGLDAYRRLVLLDTRGTGGSAIPDDPRTYRADRQVDDVEALREHLGLEQVDLLGHSAGAQLAMLYAVKHPTRVRRLLVITGGHYTVGERVEGAFETQLRLREGEPWYADAHAAMRRWFAAESEQEARPHRLAAQRLLHGTWNDRVAAFAAELEGHRNPVALAGYLDGMDLDIPAIRAALGALDADVLVYAGEFDGGPTMAEATAVAKVFRGAELIVQPGAGHYPWVDDPAWFARAVGGFLSGDD